MIFVNIAVKLVKVLTNEDKEAIRALVIMDYNRFVGKESSSLMTRLNVLGKTDEFRI